MPLSVVWPPADQNLLWPNTGWRSLGTRKEEVIDQVQVPGCHGREVESQHLLESWSKLHRRLESYHVGSRMLRMDFERRRMRSCA